MFILNGKSLALDTPFEHNGVQYPANWLRLTTLAEKIAIGISEEPDAPAYDDRFYWGPGNAKDLDQLKTQWVTQTKQTAGSLLQQTDWMVIRKAERDIAIPKGVALYRARVVAEANRLEEAITASETVEDLITVVTAPQWPDQ